MKSAHQHKIGLSRDHCYEGSNSDSDNDKGGDDNDDDDGNGSTAK